MFRDCATFIDLVETVFNTSNNAITAATLIQILDIHLLFLLL